MAGSSRVRLDGAGLEHHGRSLKQSNTTFRFHASWSYDLEHTSHLILAVSEDHAISLLHGMWRSNREGGGDCCCFCEACWPGIRANCHSNTQVECEVGGVAGCSCLAMEACLPEVSGCFIVVNGISTKSCGF